jgi:Uma2 family endonuclease
MTVSAQTKPALYTAEDLEHLSDEGHHYELIKGELRPMSPSGGPHGDATSRVSFYVNGVVYGDDLGMTFAAETGFFVERDPDTVKAPDFAFVSYERLPDPLPEGYVPLVPDLAVETRSPNDTAREVAEKVEEWLAAGVRLVWVIEPRKRTITTHRQGRPPQVLGISDTLGGEDVLPGLAVPVARVFPPRRD